MRREKTVQGPRGRRRRLLGVLAAVCLVAGAAETGGETASPAGPAEGPPPAAPTAAAPGPSKAEGIELHVKNEEVANVLEMLSRQYELNIIASKNVKGKVTADLYRATIDQVLDAICRSNVLEWKREGDTIYLFTPEEAKALKLDEARLKTEIFPLNYLTGEEAQKLVAPTLSTKATVAINTASEVGIPSGAGATGGNSFGLSDFIVVKDFPENLEGIRAILAKMDRRPRQVLVEATVLEVTLSDSTSLGVDFNTLAGIDFRDLTNAAGAITATPLIDPTGVPGAADTLGPMKMRGISPTDRGPWGHVYTQGFASSGPGINFGVITNNVAIFINALESVTDTTVLSNPKVLALNKQRAEVIVGDRFGYRTTTTTETTTVQTIQFLDTGTQLIFRPFISDDGYVRLEVHPKVSSGFVDPNGLPQERTTEVTCNILVRDGHTVVIGGMFQENVNISKSQVPGVGNIPVLGMLFRNDRNTSVRREIIVLLTPHIIEDDQAFSAASEALLADGRRRCLGMREGFGLLTRERLTNFHMGEADKAWRKYEQGGGWLDRCAAWWNVHLALSVAPNNLKALRLKDKVLSSQLGRPYEPPDWTVWDSLGPHIQALEEAKRRRAAAQPPPAAPADTSAPAAPGETPAPAPAAPATQAKEAKHEG